MSDDQPTGVESTRQREDTPYYTNATGGWGSLKGVSRILADQRPTAGALRTLVRQNKPGGHMCTSCAWTKPALMPRKSASRWSGKRATRQT